MSNFWRNHPDVERLQHLSDQPLNETNAEEFMIFLEKAFINNSWEQYQEPSRIVNAYLGKLSTINESWSSEISNAINSSNSARWELASSIRPQSRPHRSSIEHNWNTEDFSHEEYNQFANEAIREANNIIWDREVFIFQYYFNLIHKNNILIDGNLWPETTWAILSHIKATQILLDELWADVDINDEIDSKTQKALKEYMWLDVETTSSTAIDRVQEQFDKINELSTDEAISRLSEATELSDRSSYISLLSYRFKTEGYIIRPNTSNDLKIYNASGSEVSLDISQENIGAIMILMASTNEDIVANRLDRNIWNNIFDTIIEEFEFKRENGEAWKAQDFISDDVRTEADVSSNKTACISQIEEKITELTNSLNESTTTDAQKTSIRAWIQKLEVAKIFVQDQSVLSDNSLQIAHNVAAARNEVARMFGSTPESWAKNAWAMEAGDIKSFMIGQTPRLIIAGIFALLTKLLPSPFKEAALAWIGGITGLGMYEDAQDAWLVWAGDRNLRGINPTNITTPGGDERADILRNILTNAPSGIESRHETVYARIIEKNEEGSHIRERESLDTIFLFLSQDFEFWQKDVSDLDDLNSTTVWDTMSEYSKDELMWKWISWEDVLSFMRLLKAHDVSDTSDEHIEDLFVVGQVTDSANRLEITWVNGEVFSEENREVNGLVSRISWLSYGVDSELRNNSVRAKVEEALAKAQPWVLSWMWQAVAERTNLIADQVPTAENVWEVLTALSAINATWVDQAAINRIIEIYESISEELTLNESVHTYLAEASAVYTLSWRAFRGLENTVYWVQGLGQTIPTNPGTTVTPDMIDDLISQWESHTTALSGQEDLLKDVNTTIENLRLYKVKLLDDAARVSGINAGERDRLIGESDTALAAIISANPDDYLQTLQDLEAELQSLKGSYTTTEAYLDALGGNISELVTLQRLARITTTNTEFESEADRIFDEIFTNGIAWNLKAHLEAKNRELSNFTVNSGTLVDIQRQQSELDTIRKELLPRNWTTDVIGYFEISDTFVVDIDSVNYVNISASLGQIFKRIDPTFTPISFDPNVFEAKQGELNETLNRLGSSFDVRIPTITDVTNSTQVTTQRDAIRAKLIEIGSLPETFQTGKTDELKANVSTTIDAFTTKIGTYGVTDTSEIEALASNYAILIDTEIGNTENTTFEETYELKMQEITEYFILNTAIKNAPDTIDPILNEIAILMWAWTIDNNWTFIENISHPFHRDVIAKVDTWITFAEMFAEINSGLSTYPTNVQTSINSKKWEILKILAPGLPIL